jgi:HK97 gp10 family phage protein
MKFHISLTGAKEIDKVLLGLPAQLSHPILQAAHAAAAKPLIEKEKLLAPEGPNGDLVDSIGAVKTPFAKATVVGEVIVGPRRSRRYKGHHGHLVEFGTRPRKTQKGANRGTMTKKPFASPAFKITQPVVINRISTEVGRKLYAYMKRVIR